MSVVTPVIDSSGAFPWRRSIAWLVFLAPFFFLSYGFSNHLAEQQAVTRSIYFEWERHIPFVAWTIIPYWSIDFLYGASFLTCRDRRSVDNHALRLLTAQVISVACFIAYPLHFAFVRPEVEGVFGRLFDALMGFDRPYNQAPSLHIGLLVVIWARFIDGTSKRWHPLIHGWAALIAVSVLTTYQHHFIDVPTGMTAGLFCLWLWPDKAPSPLADFGRSSTPRHRALAWRYALGAAAVTTTGLLVGGLALWLLWPAVALVIVSLIYFSGNPAGFQKHARVHSMAVTVLLAPYRLAAWLNARWWTRNHPQDDEIADGVWLGRLPDRRDLVRYGSNPIPALYDVCAELPAPNSSGKHVAHPWLDLVTPTKEQLREAVWAIETLRHDGPVRVCCALGFSRSACAVAAWLLATKRANSVDHAISLIQQSRPMIIINKAYREALHAFATEHLALQESPDA